MKHNCILVRYGEIGLKGNNRAFFENRLMNNLRNMLNANGVSFEKVRKISGRLVVVTSAPDAAGCLKNVFGIVSLSPAISVKTDLKEINAIALDIFNEDGPKTFRISARRLDKRVKKTSSEMNGLVGQYIVDNTSCKVKLKSPDLDIGIEMTTDASYMFNETYKGPGGLPTGVSGKVICLLSGGIDSPVAAWLCMRRGCEVVFVHFLHKGEPGKIKDLVEYMKRFHTRLKLVLVPVDEIERELIRAIPSKYRIIMLRRMFLRISEKLMKVEKCKAIVTGDNIAQVASQTIENLGVIQRATDELVILPLSCYNKQEIVDLAKAIGTYEKSIVPYIDCCNFLVPPHPETRARLEEIIELEKNINMAVVDAALAKIARP